MIINKKLALAISAFTLSLDSASVLAQLEEVVVTARKREESLQDVPVVVTAMDRVAIEQRSIASMDDLGAYVPGLTSASGGGTDPSGSMSLRGVKTGSINVTSDQSVTLNIDGMQVESVLGYRSGQVDLARIEVLKGPQALFFGKNSPGGVVAITTANPTEELYVRARVGYEVDDGDTTSEIIVSGPITDTLGGRAVVNYTKREGWLSNEDPTAAWDNGYEGDQLIARATLEWVPNDNFYALGKLTYSEWEGENRSDAQKIHCFDPAATAAECKLDDRITYAAPLDLLGRYNGLKPFDDSDSTFATLKLVWNITDTLELTSLTGYYDTNQEFYQVSTSRAFSDLTDQFGDPVPNEILNEAGGGSDSISQEFRLTSNYDGPLNFMVGMFYDDRTIYSDAKVQFAVLGFPDIRQEVDAEAFSAFGQLTWDITEKWELSAGIRYTDEEKTFSGYIAEDALLADPATNFVIVPPPGTPPEFFLGEAGDPVIPTEDKITPDNTSPEVTLTWRPTDDMSIYAAYKEGFKSGSFDASSTANQIMVAIPQPIDFKNEEVTGGELGFKTQWADNQLRVNGAFYFYDYENMQLDTFDPITVSTRTINAGESEVKGFEVEVDYAPIAVPGLRVYGSYNYNDAEFKDFVNTCNQTQDISGTCPDDPAEGFQNLAGAPLTLAPENAATLGINYDGQFGGGMNYRLGAVVVYSDEYQTNGNNDPLGIQDSYTTLGLNAAIASADEAWTLEVIGKNVTDEDYFVSSVSQPLTGGVDVQQDFLASKARGREVIVQLTYQLQ